MRSYAGYLRETLFLLIFCAAGVAISCHTARAQVEPELKSVTTIGVSRIYTDVPNARYAAIAECLLTSVENTAIEMLPATTVTDEFEPLSKLLSGQRDKFIIGYKVLKEIKTENDYRVLVQVSVSKDKLKQELVEAGILMGAETLPTVVFLVAERYADDLSFQYWWRKGKPLFQVDAAARPMMAAFEKNGFPVIDPENIPDELFDDMDLPAQLSDEAAIALGKLLNADLVVPGTAIADQTPNRMGKDTLSFKGTINARVLSVKTGQAITTIEDSTAAIGRDLTAGSRKALADAGSQAALKLADEVYARWMQLKRNTGMINLHIKGENILPYLVMFRESLRTTDGIKNQRILEMTPNEALVAVDYAGSPQELADVLILKGFEDFGVNIYDISQNTLNIELIGH